MDRGCFDGENGKGYFAIEKERHFGGETAWRGGASFRQCGGEDALVEGWREDGRYTYNLVEMADRALFGWSDVLTE